MYDSKAPLLASVWDDHGTGQAHIFSETQTRLAESVAHSVKLLPLICTSCRQVPYTPATCRHFTTCVSSAKMPVSDVCLFNHQYNHL